MAKITQVANNAGDYEAHAAGCSDLKKRKYAGREQWTHEFETIVDVQLDHCQDFLLVSNGPEMALEHTTNAVTIFPCAAAVLAEGSLPTYVEYYGDDAERVVENLRKYEGYYVNAERFGETAPEPTEFEKMVAASAAANARAFG